MKTFREAKRELESRISSLNDTIKFLKSNSYLKIKNVGLNLEVITNRSPEYFPFTVKLLRNFEKYLYKIPVKQYYTFLNRATLLNHFHENC